MFLRATPCRRCSLWVNLGPLVCVSALCRAVLKTQESRETECGLEVCLWVNRTSCSLAQAGEALQSWPRIRPRSQACAQQGGHWDPNTPPIPRKTQVEEPLGMCPRDVSGSPALKLNRQASQASERAFEATLRSLASTTVNTCFL